MRPSRTLTASLALLAVALLASGVAAAAKAGDRTITNKVIIF
jgi:hypothetical protein